MLDLATLVISAADPVPEPDDVVAGWTAFGLFLGLLVVIFLLGYSLRTRLRNVDAAEEQGLYDPPSARGQRQREQRLAGRGLRSASLPQDGDQPPGDSSRRPTG